MSFTRGAKWMVVVLVMVSIGLGGRWATPSSQAQSTDQPGGCLQSLPDGYFTTDWKTACEKDAQPIGPSDAPQPGSKNARMPLAVDSNGVTKSYPLQGDSKQPAAGLSLPVSPTAPQMIGDSYGFIACSAGGGGGWTTTANTWQVVRSCTATFPEDGFVYINATSSVGLSSDITPFEARIGLNIDNPAANGVTDRWVNIYTDSGDGTDKSVADDMISPVISGTHTFYFLATRAGGSGTVQLYNPTISVLYYPNSNPEVMACGVTNNLDWSTTESTFQIVRSCTLTVTQPGYVYVSGTSAVALSDSAYEVRLRVGVDSTSGSASSDRWINVYTDAGDGTDEAVATSNLTSVTPGLHTFYFLAARYNGTGTVVLYDPSLSVLFFPATNVTAKTCGATGSDVWTNATTDYTVVRSCTVDVPARGFAFVAADASAGLNATTAGSDWEGQFRFGLDNSTIGNSGFDRWINLYTDTGDGTDRTLALSGMFDVSAGSHTFYVLGKRYTGTGTLRLYSPSLTVIVPVAHLYLPVVLK